MLNLPTPASALLVVTDSAVATIAVHASWVDLGPVTQVTPGSLLTAITLATTTVVVPPPGGVGIDRNVKFLSINNESASGCVVTVQITDGVNTINIFGPIALPSHWTIQYNSDGSGFVVYDNFGNIQVVARVAALNAVSAGTQVGSTGTIAFVNSNGVTFGMSDSSLVTASVAAAGINLSAGTTSNLASAFTFANGHGVSFGLDAQTLTASIATSAHFRTERATQALGRPLNFYWMLARLICFLLGHALEELEAVECPQPHLHIRRGKCARCGVPIFELRDLRDEPRRMHIRFPTDDDP